MGRAGSGGGGHRSSGGGHSSGRSGGGHRVGSSFGGGGRRAGSGSFGGGFGGPPRGRGPHGGPGMPPPPPGGYGGPGMPPPPPPRRYYRTSRGYYGAPPPPRRGGGCFSSITAFCIVVLIAIFVLANSFNLSRPTSTIEREKLDTQNAYMNDCIIDEIGWFDNISKTSGSLKEFWKETGIQPYIILKAYDANLTSDSQKDQWATDYYDQNFDTENIFLVVYFAEADTDNDVGYMAYANGYQTSSVMDSEAVDIFWNYIDKYWYTDMSTDEVFINAFNDTADTIMHVSTTGKDIFKWIIILVVVIIAGSVIVNLVKQKNKRDKEKAEEDQKILNTPIHDMAEDNLEDKYL